MQCKISNCDLEATYKNQQVCQKHYFRKMRYGTYDLTSKRQYRRKNQAGYLKVYEPQHILSDKQGYVYEHRFIYFNKVDNSPKKCKICHIDINWNTLHIDHIDKNVSNNKVSNLRPLCRGCNTHIDRKTGDNSKYFIECRGEKLTASQWARKKEVQIAPQTIRRRLLKGESVEDAIFRSRKTHHNTKTKKIKLKTMTD